MLKYQLMLEPAGAQKVIYPVTDQPYGSFQVGGFFYVSANQYRKIERIAYATYQQSSGFLVLTVLQLGEVAESESAVAMQQ